MTYVKINKIEYPAAINGTVTDRAWDNRESKTIRLEMAHADALALFVNDAPWSIVERYTKEELDEEGNIVTSEVVDEYDNSEYCVAGSITDHRDGTVSVKMGKPTDAELLAIIMGGN